MLLCLKEIKKIKDSWNLDTVNSFAVCSSNDGYLHEKIRRFGLNSPA